MLSEQEQKQLSLEMIIALFAGIAVIMTEFVILGLLISLHVINPANISDVQDSALGVIFGIVSLLPVAATIWKWKRRAKSRSQ